MVLVVGLNEKLTFFKKEFIFETLSVSQSVSQLFEAAMLPTETGEVHERCSEHLESWKYWVLSYRRWTLQIQDGF